LAGITGEEEKRMQHDTEARIRLRGAGANGTFRYTHVIRVNYPLSAEQLAALRRRAERHVIGIAELIRQVVEELAERP
jgi:hypothetical protein